MNVNIPKIPGLQFGEELLRTNFRKTQVLTNNDRMNKNSAAPFGNTFVMASPNSEGKAASLDRKVLRFACYFREGVHESRLETERVRKTIIYYFLEDDTIAVTEPKQDNSGIAGQGSFIKRHQVPKSGGQFFTFEDFNIGMDVQFYGKTFHIVDCDDFTRRFLEQVGLSVPTPEEYPGDEYSGSRKKQFENKKRQDDGDFFGGSQRTTITTSEISKTKQFLARDKEVLKFECFYDDRVSLYGDIHLFTLYYFLADDTIEITEANPPNCGRDPFPSFVKRSKVPKIAASAIYENPGASLLFKTAKTEYLTHADLRIGNAFNIFGRHLLIYDCDDFTQRFLREVYGLTDFTPIDVSQKGPAKVTVTVPPHNGFGDEEDSLGSWQYLAVKPVKKDIERIMKFSDKQLKFQLRLTDVDPSNAIRRFVLTYFLSDDQVSIFEPAQRNSGVVGGKFLNKQKVKKSVRQDDYLTRSDLYVGATITVNNFSFYVCGTDDKTLELMEELPEWFQVAYIPSILTKIRDNIGRGVENFQSPSMEHKAFVREVEGLRLPLVDQEVLHLVRYLDKKDGTVDTDKFLSIVRGK